MTLGDLDNSLGLQSAARIGYSSIGNHNQTSYDLAIDLLNVIIILPDCVGIFILLLAVFGMYYGIEVRHPLYAILYANLIFALLCSLTSAWGMTSIIRYIWLYHNDWIHSLIPNPTAQCLISILWLFCAYVIVATAPTWYAWYFLGMFSR